MSLGQPVHHKSVAFHQNRTEKGSNSPATAIQSKEVDKRSHSNQKR
jgi:hypothetical protein